MRRALATVALLIVPTAAACGDGGDRQLQTSARAEHFVNAECLKLERLYPAPDGRACAGQRPTAVARVKRMLADVSRLRRQGRILSPAQRRRGVLALQRERFVEGRFSARQFQHATGLTNADLAVLAEWLYARNPLRIP